MTYSRLIFFGGKGGVGKTTLSCALSLMLSKEGKSVLLISTDPAHSLSDLFKVKIKGITEVYNSLFALEIDPYGVMKRHIELVLESLESILNPDTFRRVKEAVKGVEDTPGAEESAVVEELSKVILSNLNKYDHFVVDTAPTGHTLHMLRSTARVGGWIEELLKNRKKAQSLWKAGGSAREDRTIKLLEERRERFLKFHQLLTSSGTEFIPVLNPEKLSIEETHRLVNRVSSMSINISRVVVNKVLPSEVSEAFLLRRKEQEKKHLEDIHRRFGKYRIIELRMRERDIDSLEELKDLTEELRRRL